MCARIGSGVSSVYADLEVEVVPDAPLGTQTWYGVGGRADSLVRPLTLEALAMLVRRCYRSGTPCRVFGSGANLLVDDGGVDGVVVRLDAPVFTEFKYNRSGPTTSLRAMAGADMAKTLMDTVKRGLSGLTQMAGIPASVGGAIAMNAGGKFGSISDHLRDVCCITRSGEIVSYPASELRFEYRETNIPDPIIVWGTFALEPDDPIELRERVKSHFAFKKSTQPLAENSAGCTFKNPIDPSTGDRVSAGRLIDEAGLKGTQSGGASVSRHHANFIVTAPGATATDVRRLLATVRTRVYDTFGIELEPEVVIWTRGEGGEL